MENSMELSFESTWEIFEFTVLKRDKDQTLTDAVTVHLYDDDRDLFLCLKGFNGAAIETTVSIIQEAIVITPYSFDNQETDCTYFSIGGNPPQAELRQAMLATISKLQQHGFNLRKLEDTWV